MIMLLTKSYKLLTITVMKVENFVFLGSLENLTVQVQQELNNSARLDESLISGLQVSKYEIHYC